MNSPGSLTSMEHFVKNRTEMIEYNLGGMLAPQSDFRYDEVSINSQVNPSKDYTYSSQGVLADTSILELGAPSRQNLAPTSSFELDSSKLVVPSFRSSALSSCHSVVSSSSLVSGSSILFSGEDDILPGSKEYSELESQFSIPVFDKDELRILSRCLPHTKIKKIIKCSGAVNQMIGSEVPALLAIACELFVRDLTSFSWDFTKRANRRTVQVQDIKSVSSEDLRFRRLLHSKKRKLRNSLTGNELLEQSKAPIFDYYENRGVYPKSMQVPPTPPSIIFQTPTSPKYSDKSKNVQQNILDTQLFNEQMSLTHNTNQEPHKSCLFSPVQYTQDHFDPVNHNFNYINSNL